MTKTTAQVGNGITCGCGRWFKNRLGFGPHSRVCPEERARSEAFVEACSSGDWATYEANWAGR